MNALVPAVEGGLAEQATTNPVQSPEHRAVQHPAKSRTPTPQDLGVTTTRACASSRLPSVPTWLMRERPFRSKVSNRQQSLDLLTSQQVILGVVSTESSGSAVLALARLERRPRIVPTSGASADVPLQTLLNHVIRARTELADGRHTNLRAAAMEDARAQMVTALETYIWALNALHLQVPYTLRDELRTQRSASRSSAEQVAQTHPDSAAPKWANRGRWSGFHDGTLG
jgi:hypothetical protein